MKTLIVALLAGCCLGLSVVQTPVSIGGQPWTAYTFDNNDPAVVRISAPDIKFALPPYPSVSVRASAAVVAPAAAPLAAPVIPAAPIPVVKAAVAVPAPAPVVPVAVAVAPEPLQAPEPPMPSIGEPFVGGQFHAQDEAGQYSFGHWGGPNTRVETRDSLGRTTGSFAYVDPEGDVQVRKYAAAPASGFKVAASDLPVDTNLVVQDTPEVARVKAAHARAFEAARSIISHATVAA
ncbi:cuticle protein 7-like [Macrobrachium rosenbergii]|uniref:cuticle protein 7-like n=1 Tax=Macrobrachium rosenbergii TaxID=79674 RepID=UPI0034D53519